MSLILASLAFVLAASLILNLAQHWGIRNRNAAIGDLSALAETHRQEAAKLRAESNMYQNELKEVRDKCVGLRERAQIVEGHGENINVALTTLIAELNGKTVINRIPIRFLGLLNYAQTAIRTRDNALAALLRTKSQ